MKVEILKASLVALERGPRMLHPGDVVELPDRLARVMTRFGHAAVAPEDETPRQAPTTLPGETQP